MTQSNSSVYSNPSSVSVNKSVFSSSHDSENDKRIDPLDDLDAPSAPAVVKETMNRFLSGPSLFFSGLMGTAAFLLIVTLSVKFVYVPSLDKQDDSFTTAELSTHQQNGLTQINALSVQNAQQNPQVTPQLVPKPVTSAVKIKTDETPSSGLSQGIVFTGAYEGINTQIEKARLLLSEGSLEQAIAGTVRAYEGLKPLAEDRQKQLLQMDILDLLAITWEKSQKFSDAIAAAERSLKLASSYYGDEHPEVAYRYERLSSLYDATHQTNLAIMAKERALNIAEKDETVNRDHLAMNFNNLGESYRSQKDYNRAEVAFRKAVKMIESIHGTTAPEIAVPLNNLGMTAFEIGNFTDAESYMKRSLEIFLAKEGEQSASAEKVMRNLKVLLEQQGRRREADDLIRRYFL